MMRQRKSQRDMAKGVRCVGVSWFVRRESFELDLSLCDILRAFVSLGVTQDMQ